MPAVSLWGSVSPRHIVNEITCSFPIGGLDGRRGVGAPMFQSIIFAIILYLTPSLLLVALLTCREGFSTRDQQQDYLFDEELRPSRER